MFDDLSLSVAWLSTVRASDGGWGIYPGEDSGHLPITGEVAVALGKLAGESLGADAALISAKEYLLRVLDDAESGRDRIKSVVHLAWLILGCLRCGIEPHDPRLGKQIGRLLEARTQAWGWKLEAKEVESGLAIYPTYLSLWAIREAITAGLSVSVELGGAAAWLLALRSNRDFLWGDDTTPISERVLFSAYALLGLHYCGFSGRGKFADLDKSFNALADAVKLIKDSDCVVIETGRGHENNPIPWHHCVLQQVAAAFLRMSSEDRATRLLVSRLMWRYTCMMQGENGIWQDPVRRAETPYVASDSVFVGVLWRESISGFVACEIAVDMGHLLEERAGDALRSKVEKQEWWLGFSRKMYFMLSNTGVLLIALLSLYGRHIDFRWGLRAAITIFVFQFYLPLIGKARSPVTKFGIFAGLASVLGLALYVLEATLH